MSALFASLAALLLSSPIHAQFEAAVVSPSGIGPPGGPPPVPAGRADTRTSPPQQIDFSAPAQFDFSEGAAPAPMAPERDERRPARRTPASAARDSTGADNASSPSAAAARKPTKRRVEDDDTSVFLGSPE
jgi:hypothetical protein